jgi:hypothetical protein
VYGIGRRNSSAEGFNCSIEDYQQGVVIARPSS